MFNRLARSYATCFGLGHLIYPGLFGALTGAVLAYFLSLLGWQARLLLILILFVLGLPAATIAERHLRRKDPKPVIIDEVIGVLIASITISFDPYALLLALFFFLVFDWWKPWPANRFESLPGGWGIIMDDAVAGIYALVIVSGISYFVG